MQKRIFPAVLALLLLISSVGIVGAIEQADTIKPTLTISGTTAYCVGKFRGSDSDEVSAILTLKLGSNELESWSATGYGSVLISKTYTVETGKTYTLVLSVVVNGVAQPDAVVTARS